MSDAFITAAELARRLNIHVRTLHRLRERGEGPPAIRIGGAYRYEPVDVEQWLHEQANPKSAPAREEVKTA
jgi:excisionase family DNA binding protein